MAKSKDQSGLFIVIVVILSALSAAWNWSKQNWPIVAGVCAAILFIVIFRSYLRRKAHRAWLASLKEKYGDDEIVSKIERRKFWLGQTAEMLIDSLGRPENIENKVLKTKTKATWKYNHKHSNQYGLRILMENDIVTSWEQK